MNYEEYKGMVAKLSGVEERAMAIAKALVGSRYCYITDYNENSVEFEYNDACNCHPETAYDSFPAEWLFIDNWEELIVKHKTEVRTAREAAAAKKVADYEAEKERLERAELAKLQAKYGPPNA